MTIAQILKQSWGRDTSRYPHLWTPETPSVGQSAATSAALFDVLGYTIVRGWAVLPNGTIQSHYYNADTDYTWDQFPIGTTREDRPGNQGIEARIFLGNDPEKAARITLLRERLIRGGLERLPSPFQDRRFSPASQPHTAIQMMFS